MGGGAREGGGWHPGCAAGGRARLDHLRRDARPGRAAGDAARRLPVQPARRRPDGRQRQHQRLRTRPLPHLRNVQLHGERGRLVPLRTDPDRLREPRLYLDHAVPLHRRSALQRRGGRDHRAGLLTLHGPCGHVRAPKSGLRRSARTLDVPRHPGRELVQSRVRRSPDRPAAVGTGRQQALSPRLGRSGGRERPAVLLAGREYRLADGGPARHARYRRHPARPRRRGHRHAG